MRFAGGRFVLVGLLAGLMSGCAQLSAVDARLQEMTGQLTSSGKTARADDASGEASSRSLDAILADLQRGQYRQGRRDLDRYLARHPDDAVARAIMQQLEADPERVLGEESHRYVVRSGDSYSALAERHLGDAGLFLLLARYNESTDPSDLRVGEVIRLPGPPSGGAVATPPVGEAGRPARRSLAPAPRPSRETVAALALPDAPLAAQRSRDADDGSDAAAMQRRGLALLEQGDREAALAQLEAALEQDPSLEPAASRVPELRQALVADYHQRAILRYRNQKLGDAIALWDRVLAIDPTFEPARSYRARARELQRRLEDL
ncbi:MULTISPECIES: LysM domain-containing protein [unclassified Guyparkeria]|uniref:LysM peptidoglycan-binding domain-containing protein n=1 Tax=unclassified Guyparkeria TaxID=2626246 RepID=UPI000733478B|nr:MULTISPECIES: LysM domain-containing protein [unclassified Guyparkeria]KTG16630.1 hypothetical protein AUR63_00770 [Guyparkeria sp. XI15]OAE85664.1 hypothetical protein AWR35_00770 [Guyparkeria sp. WRN-7]